MNKLLLVIDVQESFINENTNKYVERIKELIDSNEYEYIAFTKFINNPNSMWYRELNYKGCMTEEQQKIVIDTKNYKVFEKNVYSALNDELRKYINDNNIEQIYLCGFDTDACIQKTALDLFENEYDVFVLKDYCMCHSSNELHNTIINNLKRLIGYNKVV